MQMDSIKKGQAMSEVEPILTAGTREFLDRLHKKFELRRQELMLFRQEKHKQFCQGLLPDFLPETTYIRKGEWKVNATVPDDMKRRIVEITGPVDRKMVINALNSGADVFMADFEDSNSPTWSNCINGQHNLKDAVNKVISLETPKKTYKLNDTIAKLMVRPRGWHLNEKHYQVDGQPISASLFDFGVFFFNNAPTLVQQGQTPAFYLPKLEHYLEARLWADVFKYAEEEVLGTSEHCKTRATVLIETLPAAFQMNEIIYELRNYIAGLNAGRWDYIFSAIKVLGANSDFVFPNRSQVTMSTKMMESYAQLIIGTCHRRGVYAIGGMSAYIPRKDNEQKNTEALQKVRDDKLREAYLGHDGTWVAHPGLIPIAREAFDKVLRDRDNQLLVQYGIPLEEAMRDDLLEVPEGDCTYEELCNNIRVCLQYMASWMQGIGCVPLNYLMEDLATAEISRIQVWQWAHHTTKIDGECLDWKTVELTVDQECQRLISENYSDVQTLNYVSDALLRMLDALPENVPQFISTQLYGDLDNA